MLRCLMLLPTLLLTRAASPLLLDDHPLRGVPMAQLFQRALPGAEYAGLALWTAITVWVWVLADYLGS